MFFQTVPGSNPGISRPFIVGLVMLLLFLSMQVKPLIERTKLFGKAYQCGLPSDMVQVFQTTSCSFQDVLHPVVVCHCQGLIWQQGCLIAQVMACRAHCI